MTLGVSVPLPGFMGLRQSLRAEFYTCRKCFSPVAGIHGVATASTAAGGRELYLFQSRCRDSWGCDADIRRADMQTALFQSRCRDSWGCDEEALKPGEEALWVSVPLPGFMGLRRTSGWVACDSLAVSVPLPGFMGLRQSTLCPHLEQVLGFSPVAGIHGVATRTLQSLRFGLDVSVPLPGFMGLRLSEGIYNKESIIYCVSVPLPGFMGLRQKSKATLTAKYWSFSPVAGIHGVATYPCVKWCRLNWGFSPVAGIHGVAT